MKWPKVYLTFLVALAVCISVHGKTPPPKKKAFQPSKKYSQAQSKFAFEAFKEIRKFQKKKGQKNLFISPISLSLCLSMVYNGAGGSTQKGMAKALQLQGLNLKEINESSQRLVADLQSSDPKVKLQIANSIWANQSLPIKKDFISRCQKYFQAQVENRDFSNPSVPKEINSWVKKKTYGKIEKILDEISPADLMILINSIYFKGAWKKNFEKKYNQKRNFVDFQGNKSKETFMFKTKRFPYLKRDKFQMVSLPYGSDSRMSMYLFLPHKNSSLEEFYSHLQARNWKKWMKKARKTKVKVGLPRFKMKYKILLNDCLKAMGMEEAFTRQADFKAMSPMNAFIGQVLHKSYIEVNEKGTEAAAVTKVNMKAGAPPSSPPSMIMDRPFFFVIRDNSTGTILFMGSVIKL